VTFTVQGLPPGATVQIAYDWRLITNGGGGKGVVTAGPGKTSAEFRVAKPVQDEVIVDFSAPNAPSGSSNWVRTCEIIT